MREGGQVHDCLRAREDFVDLLFGEAGEAAERSRLLGEVERCASCSEEAAQMSATLNLIDASAETSAPTESFWTLYEERLRRRMAQVIPFDELAAGAAFPRVGEYRLTLLHDEGLARRLAERLRDVARESHLTWPSFRAEPVAFTGRFAAAYASFFWGFVSQRNVALGTSFSFVFVLTLVGGLIGLERLRLSYTDDRAARERYELIGMLPTNNTVPEVREKEEAGSPGMSKGKGGGSLAESLRPHGGGGGGNREERPASEGKLPPGAFLPQVVTPSPYPPTLKNPQLPVLPQLDADPVLFPPDLRPIPFGDPNSRSRELSAGPGANGGIGTGADGGVGSGRGGGFGPGEDGNTGGGRKQPGGGGPGGDGGTRWGDGGGRDGVLPARNVTRRAVLLSKPEPGFTEEARKNGVTGTVKLRLALRADGTISDISVVKGLPDGLTERAIQAARRIQFTPAQKDGRNVSQWVTIEYNFNIY
jgi:TonB family protein